MAWDRCLLGFDNRVHTCPITILAGAIEPALPVSNWQVDQMSPSQAVQTAAGCTTLDILIDQGSDDAVCRLIGAFRHNLTAAATWRIRIGSYQQVQGDLTGQDASLIGDQGGVQLLGADGAPLTRWLLHDSGDVPMGVVPGYGQAVHHIPLGPAGRYCRITISDPANPDGCLNIPGLYVGDALQLAYNYGYASTRGSGVQQTQQQTRAGQRYTAVQSRARTAKPRFGAIRPWELDRIDDLRAWVQTGRNLLWVPNPLSARINREAILGDAVLPDDLSHVAHGIDAMGLDITERL